MGIKDEMYVSYVIIPTKDRDQIILVPSLTRSSLREFMMKYHVLVDLVRREARVYLPDVGSPSLDVMQIDEAGKPTPVSLEEFMTGATPKPKPKAVNFSVVPEIEVIEVSEGEDCDSDRTDDGMSCDTFDPTAPTAPKATLTWEPSVPITVDDEAWIAISSTRDLPPLDHLHPLLLPEEFDQLRGIILGNLNNFAKDKLVIGCTNIVEHSIEIVDRAEPHKEVLRRLNPEKQRQADEQVADLLHLGVIEPARSPWGSGIVMAKKKDPKVLRMCLDFRNLNAVTIKDAYPLPRIDGTITSLGGARFFTTLDFGSTLWQIVMKQIDKPKTAFATKGVLYQWTRVPFGLCNATASFQRLMNIVLKGIPQEPGNMVLCDIDDILIATTTVEQHLEKLDQVFARIAAAELKCQPSKCNLMHTKATFLGRII